MRRQAAAKLFCLLGLMAGATGARADEGADKAASAKRLIAIVLPPEMYQKLLDSLPGQLPADAQQDIKKLMPSYQEMADFETGLFVKYFTAKEMNDLLKFYQSPVGVKSLKLLPELTTDAQAFMMSRLQTALPQLMEKWKQKKATATPPADPAPADSKTP